MVPPPRSPPLFLQPASYRRRRRRDAARLLPVVGLLLILLPVLWAPHDSFRHDTAQDGIYLFVVWALLIGLAWAISRALSIPSDDDDSPDPLPDQDLQQ